MIIVKIIGGLGNQMFQYSYAEMLRANGYKVKLDLSGFDAYKLHGGCQLQNFNTDIESATILEINSFKENSLLNKLYRKVTLKNKKILKEKNLLFQENFLKIIDHTYVEGYFQSEKYFKNIRGTILNKFSMRQELSAYGKSIANQIVGTNNSCSIHVRRGDYLNDINKNLFGTCSVEYYNNAISLINTQYNDTTFFIFSNDIKWCKNNFDMKNVVFINSNEVRTPNEDIYLMSLCKNNIIANSSFSWWGSWLNNNADKVVIAPKEWFLDKTLLSYSQDIVPDSYLKI
jgi:hypothetical protein